MKFHLNQIEATFDEESLVAGEEILDAGSVHGIQEVEKNLWLAAVVDKEVEIQLTGQNVVSLTCECSDFAARKVCPHVVAALFRLRKLKQKETVPDRKSTAKKSTTGGQKLTVATILQNVEPQALFAFVSEYARRDQQFTTALKAKFASSIQHLDLEEKYDSLLHTIIKSNQSPNLSFTKTGAKKIHDTLAMLLSQAENDLLEKNYAEAFQAVKSIIEKITPILPRLQAHRNDINTALELAFRLLSRLSGTGIPPALKDQLSDFAALILKERLFNFSKIELIFLLFLQKLAQEKSLNENFSKAIDNELLRKYYNHELQVKIFLYKATVLEKGAPKAEIVTFFQTLGEQPFLKIHLIETAHEWGLVQPTKWLAQNALKQNADPKTAERIEEVLLSVAHKEDDPDSVAFYAAKRFLETHEINYFDQFAKALKTDPEKITALVSKIESLPDSDKNTETLALIYERLGMGEKLLALLQHKMNFELMGRHIKAVHANSPKQAEQLAWKTIELFLNNHLGRPPSIKMRNFFRSLFLAGLPELSRSLINKTRKAYGDRLSMSEELEIFGQF